MFSRRRLFWGSTLTAVTAAVALFVVSTGAFARSTANPADKVVAAGSNTMETSPNGIPMVLLTAKMTTSKPTDLILSVSLECSILTDVTVGGGAVTTTGQAHGLVRVWVEVDGQIVPIQSVSSPPQNTPPGGADRDKVTFCERLHRIDFVDGSQDDKLREYQETKSANAFNWLRFNVGSSPSPHVIVVKADFFTDTMNAAVAAAYVGNRTLVVEPTKMANDAIISSTGTN